MRIIAVIFTFFIYTQPLWGTNYWVSPDGNDANDGLDSASAWLTLDNGELLGVLSPGDTIFAVSGIYENTRNLFLTTREK